MSQASRVVIAASLSPEALQAQLALAEQQDQQRKSSTYVLSAERVEPLPFIDFTPTQKQPFYKSLKKFKTRRSF